MRSNNTIGFSSLKSLQLLLAVALVAAGGCGNSKSQPKRLALAPRYQSLPPKKVPDYLKDTVLERCDLTNAQPAPVSSFGLVAGLHGTGDSFASTTVREFIRKEAMTRGFNSSLNEYGGITTDEIFKSPNFAIVRVDGFIPPGARKQQQFDVFVSALEGNNTSSLAHGMLYRSDLKVNGANPQAPGYAIDSWGVAEGAIFVNPAYALNANPTDPEARKSLRQGMILAGGVVAQDRPITLRLRQPQLSMSRNIEYRLDQAFQDTNVAAARDEGFINVYVPAEYGTDWEHFIQVALHVFLNPAPDFAAVKAKQLAEEAVKPDAPLADISYCWEALGKTIVPFIAPLLTHEKPEVAFAAARAAAFLGDQTAHTVLMNMTRDSTHPFQLNAVQTLAKLPASPVLDASLRALLGSEQTTVRLAAYHALAEREDSSIMSVPMSRNGRWTFVLDVIRTEGPPLIYATRTGTPRIAVFGADPRMEIPVLFTAMNNRLSISSETSRPLLNVFYRGPDVPTPISFISSPDVPELISRLGGQGAGEQRLQFNYGDVVSLAQLLCDQKRLTGAFRGRRVPIGFVLQEPPMTQQTMIQRSPSAEPSLPAPELTPPTSPR